MVNVVENNTKKLKLHLHEKVYLQQQENGLRHDDFHRYTQYCTKRLARIRDVLKFKNGKGKAFTKKELPEVIEDVKFLELVLIDAERAWSAGVALKTEFALNDENTRPRLHAVRKFSKAVLHAQHLEDLCQRFATEETLLEAKAYRLTAESRVAAEKENYGEAIRLAEAARDLYESLSRMSNIISPETLAEYHHPAKIFGLESLTASIRTYRWAAPAAALGGTTGAATKADTSSSSFFPVADAYFKNKAVEVPSETAAAMVYSAIETRRRVSSCEAVMAATATARKVKETFAPVESAVEASLTALNGECLLVSRGEAAVSSSSDTQHQWNDTQDFLRCLQQVIHVDRELATLASVLQRLETNLLTSKSFATTLKTEVALQQHTARLFSSVKQHETRKNKMNAMKHDFEAEVSVVDAIRLCEHIDTRLKNLSELMGVSSKTEEPGTKAGGMRRVALVDTRFDSESVLRAILRFLMVQVKTLLLSVAHASDGGSLQNIRTAFALAHTCRKRIEESEELGVSNAMDHAIKILSGASSDETKSKAASLALTAELARALEKKTREFSIRVEMIAAQQILHHQKSSQQALGK
eukprot:GDKJ01016756.1.p1 GENE.GDKJ01016756.1~~GDKJ01016756.1.p1  ORF type:complete len:586 (-),score=163.90 GDKJ01016756.1:311-2068(-)